MASYRQSMLWGFAPLFCMLFWLPSTSGLEIPQAIPPGSHPGPVDGVPPSVRWLAFHITGKLISFIFVFLFLVILWCAGAGYPVLGRRRRDAVANDVTSTLLHDVIRGETGLKLAQMVNEAVMGAAQRWS